ncbi:class II glutamine amidotransferase domain-containing protein [Tautonia plasticadhaerens]|uniref:Amidohydrolase EgtC n=1 Tax=Tautonia plasticadhaerens TaxID=2527974 RepID=A0A518HFH2_9BACT|nr:hypothetical protein [Tautonia plasticadhaerens]QDV39585.1 Amidohydrolase EgtC [Tautonia plasticadhaerens]
MCRIAAYFGPPMRVSHLMNDLPRCLQIQSRDARQMADSSIAGDGWGVGWYAPGNGPTPGVLKSILPLWADLNARDALPAIVSGSFVGHIRFASPNIEVCFTNTPLYALDDRIWTINGELSPWPGPLSRAIRDRLDADHEAEVRGATDGELLGALWRTHFRRAGGRDAGAALRATLREATDLARDHDGHVKTNVILADADGLLAVRYADDGPGNSLYTLASEPRWAGGVVVASEPLDDGPGWHEVGPDTLVRGDARGLSREPLGLERFGSARRGRQSA